LESTLKGITHIKIITIYGLHCRKQPDVSFR